MNAFLTPFGFTHFAQQLHEWGVIGDQVLAYARMDAAQTTARLLDALVLAFHLVHVRRRTADVGDDAREAVHATKRAHFTQDALFAARLNHPPLVFGDRTEAAATETAAHGDDTVLDRLVGGECPRRRKGMRDSG